MVGGPAVPAAAVARFKAEPASVEVALSGPILALAAVEEVQLEVRLLSSDLVPGAQRLVPVVVRGLPECVASEIRPAEVLVRAP